MLPSDSTERYWYIHFPLTGPPFRLIATIRKVIYSSWKMPRPYCLINIIANGVKKIKSPVS